jgi:hypothetical protein
MIQPPETAAQEKARRQAQDRLERHRMEHWRVRSQDQNRLSASAFLAGLSFAAFTVLLTVPSVENVGSLRWPDRHHILVLVIAILVAAATLIFLASAYTSFEAIRRINDISRPSVRILEEREDAELSNRYDRKFLDEATTMHRQAGGFISYGLWLLFGTLVCIGFQINLVVGIVILLTLGLILLQIRTTVRVSGRHLLDPRRSRD